MKGTMLEACYFRVASTTTFLCLTTQGKRFHVGARGEKEEAELSLKPNDISSSLFDFQPP